MSTLTLEALRKSFGDHEGDHEIVKGVTATIREGEFVSLLGPSGCGKTTILRMIAGLIDPTSGRIVMGSDDITALPPNKRGLGLVFQSYALFPHLTVFENVAFGLRRRGIAGDELKRRVGDMLALVRLHGFAERYPRQLSGGQQQRVAIARAVAPHPRVLLFDEPLSNLDAQLRDEMQIEIKRLQRDVGITTLFVTHDQAEALSLSDRVCVMSKGVVQQFASPEDIYRRPATSFVAGFIGKPNRLTGSVVRRDGDGGVVALAGGIEIRADNVYPPAGKTADVIVRQEAIQVAAASDGGLHGVIQLRSFVGARVQYVIRLRNGIELVAEQPSARPSASLAPGSVVSLVIDPAAVFVLAPEV